jgi:hypothetical protein
MAEKIRVDPAGDRAISIPLHVGTFTPSQPRGVGKGLPVADASTRVSAGTIQLVNYKEAHSGNIIDVS